MSINVKAFEHVFLDRIVNHKQMHNRYGHIVGIFDFKWHCGEIITMRAYMHTTSTEGGGGCILTAGDLTSDVVGETIKESDSGKIAHFMRL